MDSLLNLSSESQETPREISTDYRFRGSQGSEASTPFSPSTRCSPPGFPSDPEANPAPRFYLNVLLWKKEPHRPSAPTREPLLRSEGRSTDRVDSTHRPAFHPTLPPVRKGQPTVLRFQLEGSCPTQGASRKRQAERPEPPWAGR